MAKSGIKHLVKCVCVLPQLSKQNDPPAHEFVVFSTYDDDLNEFDASFVQCNNCGVVHKVVDVCKSAIMKGRDELKSVVTVDEVKSSLSDKLAAVLEQHAVDLPTWQNVAWIVENSLWGSSVTLSSEYIDGVKQGKSIVILGESLYKIATFTLETSTEAT